MGGSFPGAAAPGHLGSLLAPQQPGELLHILTQGAKPGGERFKIAAVLLTHDVS